MKSKISFITIFLILVWPSLALCDTTVEFWARWPYSSSKAIAVDDSSSPTKVFLGDGNFIYILDADDLTQQSRFEVTTSGDVSSIFHSPDHPDKLYVACGSDGFKIIDVSDPSSPTTTFENETIDDATGIFVSGDSAYIAEGFGGAHGENLEIVSISDTTAPKHLSSVLLQGVFFNLANAREVFVYGDYAYVTDELNGLHIVDVRDKGNPSWKALFLTVAVDVYVDGNYAYLACDAAGLKTIDISTNPESPTLVGEFDTEGEANGIYVDGDYAYVADGSDGLQIINVSDRKNPNPASSYTTNITGAHSVYVAGNNAYVADYTIGLQKIDVSAPASPNLKATYRPTDTSGVFVTKDGDTVYAYMVDDGPDQGLRIIDFSPVFSTSNASMPDLKGFIKTTGEAHAVYVSGNYAYIADGSEGLRIIDVSDPTNPVEKGFLDTSGDAKGVFVSGDYAYVAEGSNGVEIINVTKPASPSFVHTIDTTDAKGLYVSGSYAYVADGISGLRVIDVSEKANPSLATNVGTSDASGIYVYDNYAYVADGSGGLRIINVSDPTNPGTPVTFPTSGNANTVFVSGTLAFIAEGDKGLQIIDVSDPTDPQDAGRSFDSTGTARDVYVLGDFAYLADGPGGILAIEHSHVSDEFVPTPTTNESPASGCFISTVAYGWFQGPQSSIFSLF